jgi:hypothetical protein
MRDPLPPFDVSSFSCQPAPPVNVRAREAAPSTLFGAYREATLGSYPGTVRLTERLITCAICARRVRAAEADRLGWTPELDPGSDISWSCPLCAHLCPQARDRPA